MNAQKRSSRHRERAPRVPNEAKRPKRRWMAMGGRGRLFFYPVRWGGLRRRIPKDSR